MPRAGRGLLGDYRGADERQGVYRARRVAEGIDLLIRRREIPRLDYGEPDLLDLVSELLIREVARRAEAPPRELGYGSPAGGHDRERREAHLVPDAACGVFVYTLGEGVSLAGFGHHPRQRESLPITHFLDEDRHEQRGHLVVGHLSRNVAFHHVPDQPLG